eukprot:2864331-Rhodomonas_salina.1
MLSVLSANLHPSISARVKQTTAAPRQISHFLDTSARATFLARGNHVRCHQYGCYVTKQGRDVTRPGCVVTTKGCDVTKIGCDVTAARRFP